MPDSSLLDQIFAAEDTDVETFTEAFKDQIGNITEPESYQLKKTAKLVQEKQKLLTITHGWHESSYVWHISPTFAKRTWAVPLDRVLFAIGKILHEHLPHDLLVDLFLPREDWQIKELTIKALDAGDHWAVDEVLLGRVTGQFFEVLNTLV